MGVYQSKQKGLCRFYILRRLVITAKRHNYYEIYCERGRICECDSDNFSLCLKVPAGMKCPSCKEVEKLLGKKVLTIDGVRYHVVALISDREGGWNHKEFALEDTFLFPESKGE